MGTTKTTPKEKKKFGAGRQAVLTQEQEMFAYEYVATGSVLKAHLKAYPNTTKENAKKNGSNVKKKPLVKALIKQLLLEKYADLILSRQERVRVLSDIALTGGTKDALKAIDLLNKMEGEYIEKQEVKVTSTVKYENLDDYYKALKEK